MSWFLGCLVSWLLAFWVSWSLCFLGGRKGRQEGEERRSEEGRSGKKQGRKARKEGNIAPRIEPLGDSKMHLQKHQKGAQKAPKSMPGGLWAAVGVPGGPWAAEGGFMRDFRSHFGVHLGPKNRPKIGRKSSSNQASLWILILEAPEAPGTSFWSHFGGHFGCFLRPLSGEPEFVENLDF